MKCFFGRSWAAGVVLVASTTFVGSSAALARDLLVPAGTWHGVFLPIRRQISASDITNFEAQAGKKIGAEIFFVGWYSGAWDNVARQLSVWDPMGIKAMVTWEPELKNGADPLAAILSGSQDAIINDFATKAQAYGKPFFLRFAHEMNGDWYDWSGALTGNTADNYVAAWRYVWDKFQAAGATNAIWVWCPNADSVPDESWNAIENYYPGDAYVDWVGVDFYGLTWGDNPPAAALDRVYTTYGSLKPIMIGETAAADCRHYAEGTTMTKDQWTTALFDAMAARPNVHAFFWFNQSNGGEADWRITSCPSPAAQEAYRAGVGTAQFVTR
jgi:mannan endo-1,4-beta-mannosidase